MKAKIIYYSFSGNTKKVAEAMKQHLEGKDYEVEILSLEPTDETNSFFGQCKRAIFKKRAVIKNVDYDISGVDLLCIGTPVWAFGPAPAVNTFIDNVKGVKGKKCIAFSTYGSGAGNDKCLKYMAGILKGHGAELVKKLAIQHNRVKDAGFVKSEMEHNNI